MENELIEAWLSGKPDSTCKSYLLSINTFKKYTNKSILESSKKDVVLWKLSMVNRGLSKNSVNLRISAISSFYNFCMKIDEISDNPANIDRLKTISYRNSVCLNANQIHDFLSCIDERRNGKTDKDKIRGSQDYALFLGYILLGLRNHSWRRANINDFLGYENSECYYKWESKGKTGKSFISKNLLDSIKFYMEISKTESNYIFTPLCNNFTHLPHSDKKFPYISNSEVNRRLHYYAKEASCDIEGLVVHSLRHTAATLRRTVGADVGEIKDFMNHSSAEVTDRYLHKIMGEKDIHIDEVYDLINFNG